MPADPSQVVRATVENNEYVLLEWELVPVEDAKDVVVQRDEGFGYQEVMKQAFADPDLKFQDKSTRVGEKSYAYRVFVVDSCGDYSPVGRPGNSIYLQSRRVAGSIYLEWTPYNGWRGGVSSYKIELFNERTGNFEALAVLPGNEVQFVDQFSDLGQGVQCYRVWAYESGGAGSSSLSNESCVAIEPQLFTANAFTPNGDGFNDGFTVGGAFLSEFYMAIYNRWGQLIFETRSLGDVWTGQSLQGGLAPEGVYVFKASGVGYEGSRIQRIGSVTLVR
ncbi:MAG: gliding motility-associated C-terminal domain-containing protein [Bacteroidetes bacterium]|nr:MAG: gliding motility-associated C-terminal domain-containing protein [Bacteroidota bacterium]